MSATYEHARELLDDADGFVDAAGLVEGGEERRAATLAAIWIGRAVLAASEELEAVVELLRVLVERDARPVTLDGPRLPMPVPPVPDEVYEP